MGVEKEKFQKYAVVEMMGHRKIVGVVSDSEIGGSSLLRVDVLNSEGQPDRTEYIGVSSIYCLTIVTEEAAMAAAQSNASKPAWAWDLPNRFQLTSGVIDADDDDDYDEDY